MFPRVSAYNASATDARLPGAGACGMQNAARLFDMIWWGEVPSAAPDKKANVLERTGEDPRAKICSPSPVEVCSGPDRFPARYVSALIRMLSSSPVWTGHVYDK